MSVTGSTFTTTFPDGTTIPGNGTITAEAPLWGGLGQAIAPYDPGTAFAQTVGFGASSAAGSAVRLSATGVGAIYGGIGGYQARGWGGVVPGAAVGSLLGAAGGWAADFTEATGVGGFAQNLLTNGLSAAGGAVAVNAATGNTWSQGVPLAIAIGVGSTIGSGEALALGAGGLSGPVAIGWSAYTGTWTVAATAIVGP